jgi:hypothetical protein
MYRIIVGWTYSMRGIDICKKCTSNWMIPKDSGEHCEQAFEEYWQKYFGNITQLPCTIEAVWFDQEGNFCQHQDSKYVEEELFGHWHYYVLNEEPPTGCPYALEHLVNK